MEIEITYEAPSILDGFEGDPRRAIQEQVIVCLVCAKALRQLNSTHLGLHGLTAQAYKRKFGYNRRRPLMCGTLRRLYTERAVLVGLAAAIRLRPILAQPELRGRGGHRLLALEEVLTRRETYLAQRTRREP